MAVIDFQAPAFRAAGGDLAISVSPLGLIEMSDEEFEVHGPRLQRYALNWAFYLGSHWSYRREIGEDQLTFNWTKAFADYIRRFCFGKGVAHRAPKATEAIVPRIMERVWNTDNNQALVLNEMAQQGGVSGDCFVKVAYEPAYLNHLGMNVPGRVRILPLNSSHCFPTYHPHDKRRLTMFKLKYRTWATGLDGTRQVMTYTEIITDQYIQELLNDQVMDVRDNPLGFIPVSHIANKEVSGSPWGLADINDVIPLNKNYNEKATEHSDVINYHSAPVTIVTGAKPGVLEKGPRKTWNIGSADARVYNLELTGNQAVTVAFLQMLKEAMHEMACVPIGALGNTTPISNTSGVALAITHLPLMMLRDEHCQVYGAGIQQINSFVMHYMALYEPRELYFRPGEGQPELKPGQLEVLDPQDPLTYQTYVFWHEPFPVDKLALLNELQVKLGLGLESKEGALRALGEEYPAEKLDEMEREQRDDARRAGVLQLQQALQTAAIQALTGINPTDGQPTQEAGTDEAGNPLPPQQPSVVQQYAAFMAQQLGSTLGQAEITEMNELVTQAFGTRLPTRTAPSMAA